MKIFFVNLSALEFTALTPLHEPLGGSESALCYLARHLTQRGHQVSLTANLPDGAGGMIDDIAHYPISIIRDATFFMTERFDVIILCNAPAAAAPLKALSPQSHIVLWAHVLPDQPSMHVLGQGDAGDQARAAIDRAVFVSDWQRNEVERSFGSFRASTAIGNGIAPAFENMFASPADILRAKQNRGAYTSAPYRGLTVLLRAMEGVARDTKLDVFSSMRVYQNEDKDYAPLFAQAAQNPAIINHGSVAQGELAQHLHNCAFLFYPSIYIETFCIAATEAMAAGVKVITTDLGALAQTTMGYARLVPISSSEGEDLVRDYRQAMREEIDAFAANPGAWADQRFAQVQRVNATSTWAIRAAEWEGLLQLLG